MIPPSYACHPIQTENIFRYDSDINSDAKSLLSRKINLIFGDEIDETIGSDGFTVSEISIQLKKSSKKERFSKMKENLVEAIWNQSKCFGIHKTCHHLKSILLLGKYNKDTLLMSPIFVGLVPDDEQYAQDLTRCKDSLHYSLHPVFRIIKCRSKFFKSRLYFLTCLSLWNITENGSSHKCCSIFVDEYARVYQNWTEFKTHNEYPPGYLVAPALGVYNTVDVIDSNNLNRVLLDIFPSPSTKKSSKLAAKAGRFNESIRFEFLLKKFEFYF